MIDTLFNFFSSLYGLTVLSVFVAALLCKGLRVPSVSAVGSVFVILILCVLFGFRTIETGTDTFAYYSWFKSLGGESTARDFEPLFTIIGRAIYFATSDYTVFFTIIAAVTFIYISKLASASSSIIVAPIAIVLSVSFISGVDLIANGIRNGLALSISAYAIVRYLSGGFSHKKYLLYITMASLIHASCVLFFIVFAIKNIISERYLKVAFYAYLGLFFAESFKVFDFIFVTLSGAGIGSHLISRILAFKYQESDMFSGFIKYYFFALTLIPYILYKTGYLFDKRLAVLHYIMLFPYAVIFSSPSSYRFSYLSFYLMVAIMCQSVVYTRSTPKKLAVYIMTMAMIFITYTTKTSMSYQNLLFL